MTPPEPDQVSRPLAIDLYAGAGGLSLGLEQAGFDIGVAVEFDPVHAATHLVNFPRTPLLCVDMTDVTAAELIRSAGSTVDAVVGGPPCQGFSVGGVRSEFDERNDQLLRFVDLVVEVRPRVFCLENVVGLLEDRFSAVRESAFTKLENAGYSLSGTDSYVNASDFGVPQSRKRVIVLGGLATTPKLVPPTIVSDVTVGDALDGLPRIASYSRLLTSDWDELHREDQVARESTSATYARILAGLDADPLDRSHARVWDQSMITSSRRTLHAKKTVQRFRRTPQGKVEPRSRLYRLDPEGIARTLRAGTGADRGSHTSPRPIHPVKNRVITVREAARLHGYPDWFRFHTTNWHGHRQVGNSVPPPLARAVGHALMEALSVIVPPSRLAFPLGDSTLLNLSASDARERLVELRRTTED